MTKKERKTNFEIGSKTMKRVVVIGIGAVSPIGNSFSESWVNARSGLSGIQPTTRFDVSGSKWKVAGELKEFDAERFLSPREITRLDPFVHYAVSAALMAAEDAQIIHHPSLSSGGVIIGSGRGGISTLERELQKKYSSCPSPYALRTSAYLMPSTTISMASSYVAQKLGIKGYCLGISNACASGTNAIGEAYRLVRSGYKNLVLCGGAEAPLCRICSEGYGASGALSAVKDSSASRPFDRTRDGFVLSEGACILVLEDYESALKRSAKIYGEVIGYGNTTDAFHQIKPSPEGEAEAIKAAMDEAGLRAGDISFINAHGTSTPLGDKTETEAIKLFFGRYAYKVPVTSVKSMTGHMLAASGPLEAALTLMSMKEGILPPTINLKERDPECDLDYVTESRKAEIKFAISQSFGFGGVNAVLVFKRPDA
jgi:3-oxoacyl-[acyl-carrier-protein] synthase II